jgi:hypothetical protein
VSTLSKSKSRSQICVWEYNSIGQSQDKHTLHVKVSTLKPTEFVSLSTK